MPANRTPLLVAAFLTAALVVAGSRVLLAGPTPVDSPEGEAAFAPQTADEPHDADLEADAVAEPAAAHPAPGDDEQEPAPDPSRAEAEHLQPVLAPDAYEAAPHAEATFMKPEVSPDPAAAVRLDDEGRISAAERRRWGLDEERSRRLREMRAEHGWEPGDGDLSPDRLRLRFDPHTQLAYYERREADGTWRRFWPEDESEGLRFDPRPDDAGAARLARGDERPAPAQPLLGPRGRYRAAPYIPGLRLDDDFPRD